MAVAHPSPAEALGDGATVTKPDWLLVERHDSASPTPELVDDERQFLVGTTATVTPRVGSTSIRKPTWVLLVAVTATNPVNAETFSPPRLTGTPRPLFRPTLEAADPDIGRVLSAAWCVIIRQCA